MNLDMRGPLRIAVASAPGMPSSWKDATGLLINDILRISLDAGRRSSVSSLTDSTAVNASFPLIIPMQELQSLEDIPISIGTRGRHALCLKCRNEQGIYEKHLSFSSESQFGSWKSSLAAALTNLQSKVIAESSEDEPHFDYFAAPPTNVALPPPPLLSSVASKHDDRLQPLHAGKLGSKSNFGDVDSSQTVAKSSQVSLIESIICIQANVRAVLQRFKHFQSVSNSVAISNHPQLFRSSSSSSNRANHFQLELDDLGDDYPTTVPLMNALLSADERISAPLKLKDNPASVAVNLLRMNEKAAAAASVETKFEAETLLSSLKSSIHHLETSKDELLQDFEVFRDVSRQSLASRQVILDQKEEEIAALSMNIRRIGRTCGLETDDTAKIIEAVGDLQDKIMLQSAAISAWQSELELSRENGVRLLETIQSKEAEAERQLLFFTTAIKEKEAVLTNTAAAAAATTAAAAAAASALHTSLLETKDSEIENLTYALQAKNSEIDNLVSCLQIQTDKVKDFELSSARLREDMIRHQTDADMRMSIYQQNAELKIQALTSERDALASTVHKQADALKRSHEKYVAALANNSQLLATASSHNSSMAQLQVQASEFEAKLAAKEYEISSGRVRQQELVRETESNRQLLQSALDRHNQSFATRSAVLSQQVWHVIFASPPQFIS